MSPTPLRAAPHTLRLILLVVTTVLAACGVQRVTISGNSMAPALSDGDWALTDRQVGEIRRADVVAFRSPPDGARNFVQRIIALPGERIASQAGRVSINGQLIEEPYVAEANRSSDTWGPEVMRAGEYFVMGDNRRNASDSRSWGPLVRERIWAKVLVR